MATNDKAVALDAIKKAGFPESEWQTALKVAGAESGWNPRAVNNKNKNGTSDFGLFQINSIHKPTAQEKTDPYANAKRAYKIWKDAGNKWRPWAAYNNGSYNSIKMDDLLTPFVPGMSEGIALGEAGGGTIGGAVDAVRAAVQSALDTLREFLSTFLLIIMGLVLIVLGVVILNRDSAARAAVSILTKGLSKKAGPAIKAVGKVAK